MTTRGPLTLAALASAAVPGLDPSSVVGVVPQSALDPYEVAFVQDHDHRRWVIRCPRTPAASAQLEQSAALLALLARRISTPVPAVKGWVALPEGGRAAVHSYLTGRMVLLADVEGGSQLAKGLGRALAQLHNLDPGVYEEAGVPVYDAETHRSRRLADLDRAAGTRKVPSGLLGRWEATLEDRALWSFRPVPTHGAIGESTILATPDDGEEPGVKGFLGWEQARVADPADDFAELVGGLRPEALDTVMEAYAHARVERPDKGLLDRARLVQQMQHSRTMLALVAAGDEAGAEAEASRLRALDEELASQGATGAAGSKGDAAPPSSGGAETTEPAHPRTEEPTRETAPGTKGDDAPPSSGAGETAPGGMRTPEPAQETAPGGMRTPEPAQETAPGGMPTPEPAQETAPGGMHTPEPADESDAVETEPVRPLTPVSDDETSRDGSRRGGSTPGATVRLAPVPEPEPAAPEQAEPVPETAAPEQAEPVRGSDHDTQEITPIGADDGVDDVVPPSGH